MKGLIHGAFATAALLIVLVTLHSQVGQAEHRLTDPAAASQEAAAGQKAVIAAEAQLGYCTPEFMTVLQRVLGACGLLQGGSRRACMPEDVKKLAQISDSDFNSLFAPLKDRGGVVLFDNGSKDLDDGAKALIDQLWPDRRGARYFIAVARASTTGTPQTNEALSHQRVNSVILYLKQEHPDDPDIDNEVGLLWLGDAYAQLAQDYCQWLTSRAGAKCDTESINRSVFLSWVDCQL
jgi:outer membrane protein OmpA-like peptidoglycan-associated protein